MLSGSFNMLMLKIKRNLKIIFYYILKQKTILKNINHKLKMC
jgi:hypothetical protein